MSSRQPARRRDRWLLLRASYACALLVAACASPPRPTILSQVDAVRQTDATREAAAAAPQGFALAEQHRGAAEAAWKSGNMASSQIAAERALAGYEYTQVLARVARAERELAQAQGQVAEAQKSLAQLDTKQKQAAAEANDLEQQIKVDQEAQALAPPTPATPEREAARREAARALSAQARLLCAAARLLAAPENSVNAKFTQLDNLDEQLKKGRIPAPIDVAIKLRAECLHEAVLARRPQVLSQPQSTAGDELFVALSSSNYAPSRDDRGVVVTLHQAFAASGLAPSAQAELARLGPIVQAHPTTPLLVVVHGQSNNPSVNEAHGNVVANLLRQMGSSQIDVRQVGDQLPLLDRREPDAEKRNDRVEIVFVIPGN